MFNFVTEELGRIPGVRRTQTYLLPLKIKDMDSWLPRELLPRELLPRELLYEELEEGNVKVEDK